MCYIQNVHGPMWIPQACKMISDMSIMLHTNDQKKTLAWSIGALQGTVMGRSANAFNKVVSKVMMIGKDIESTSLNRIYFECRIQQT